MNIFANQCNYIASGDLDRYLNKSGAEYLHATNMVSASGGIQGGGIWGTDIEIYAAAQLFGFNIVVYHFWGNAGLKCLHFDSHTKLVPGCSEAIFLDNRTSNHYNAVMGL